MRLKKEIDRYCGFFSERLEDVRNLEKTLFKKILLVTMLDALARVIWPKKGNRERFIDFIDQFSEWKDRNRVSLIQLRLSLAESKKKKKKEGKKFLEGHLLGEVKTRLRKWNKELSGEPEYNDLKILSKSTGNGEEIEKCRHASLLYVYRCHLVHEFNTPGGGMEASSQAAEPYYLPMGHLGCNGTTLELVYPVRFFENLFETSLANLKVHLLKNRIPPLASFHLGSHWKSR